VDSVEASTCYTFKITNISDSLLQYTVSHVLEIIYIQRDKQTDRYRQTDQQVGRETNRQRQAGRQADRETDRQTGRQAEMQKARETDK